EGNRVLETNTARTLAALNATNEAILYATSPEELYAKVCEAAFSSGDFLAATIFLHDPDTNLLRFVAGLGEDSIRLRNIESAPDHFDHEASRKEGERAMRRLARMFGAISATNEAILRAKTELELYQQVCDAAVHSGKSFATVALLAGPDSHWLKPVAGTGEAI